VAAAVAEVVEEEVVIAAGEGDIMETAIEMLVQILRTKTLTTFTSSKPAAP
jgi:hypothetical protein